MEITFQNVKLEMGQLIIDVPPDQRGAVMKFIRSKKDKRYKLCIQEYRQKRSLDANAYAWVLIGKLADVMHMTPNEVYRTAIINIGGNYEVVPIKADAVPKFKEVWERNGIGWPAFELGPSKIKGYVNMMVYYGSSTYDSRQMAALIDNLCQDCKALGIETKPEAEIASLLGAWQ